MTWQGKARGMMQDTSGRVGLTLWHSPSDLINRRQSRHLPAAYDWDDSETDAGAIGSMPVMPASAVSSFGA